MLAGVDVDVDVDVDMMMVKEGFYLNGNLQQFALCIDLISRYVPCTTQYYFVRFTLSPVGPERIQIQIQIQIFLPWHCR